MNVTNSKLPWTWQETPAGKARVVDANGFSVVNTTSGPYSDQRDAAAFIVNAVNAHEQLVAALKLARVALLHSTPDLSYHPDPVGRHADAEAAVKAALAAAGEPV